MLEIPNHGINHDMFGRAFFGDRPMPCREHMKHLESWRHLWTDHLPPMWTASYVREVRKSWGVDLVRFLACEPVHMLRTPFWWMTSHAISFHEYKNISLLLEIYNTIHGRVRPGASSICTPLTSEG